MSMATQEYVQSRVAPLEMTIASLTTKIEELTNKVLSREADMENAERRFEEVSKAAEKLASEWKEFVAENGSGNPRTGGGKYEDLMRSPALRNVSAYNGDHRMFNKWRSKIRGVLFSHDERYRNLLKKIESLNQPELASKADSAEEYDKMIGRLADEIEDEPDVVMKLSRQLHGLLTSHCEETALSIVDSLDDHGALGGLEAYRRLFADQRGTVNQRIDTLREKVIYPERISSAADVMNAITGWERSYTELVEMSSGNFKLDEKGRIGALKRLLPQEIVSSMILISANLRAYKEAREFALEQSAELRNSAPKKKQG